MLVALYASALKEKGRRSKKQPALKKNGQPRKIRMPNRKRHRSIMNRQKLQDLPEKDFAAGCRMSRQVFEQLLALVQQRFAQRCRKRKLPQKHQTYDHHVDPYVALAFTLRWLAGAQRWDLM